MRVWELNGGFGLDNVRVSERPESQPGPGQVLIAVSAVSLNFRDHLLVAGSYNPRQPLPVVLLSDAAGTVLEISGGVTRVKPGDRVVASFFPKWESGPPTAAALMSAIAYPGDGVLSQRRVFDEQGLFAIPPHLSDAEASTLPCAGLTAWSAINSLGNVTSDDLVLVQGTGGVALFALQFAKGLGAKVIITSSSDEKLERAKELGADHTINYRVTPEWGKAAQTWAGGRAPDHVIEVGGAETLERSIRAVKPGGTISMIGVLTGSMPSLNLPMVVMRQVRLQGVTVGSSESFRAMLQGIDTRKMKPMVDRVFAFTDLREAMHHMATGQAFGKIVIDVKSS